MKELFKKLDDAQVNVLALLAEEDRVYCSTLFENYTAHVNFIQTLLQHTVQAWDTHQQLHKSTREDFCYEITKMDEQLEAYQKILEQLTEKVIRLIEAYFKEKYNIDFVSLHEAIKKEEYKLVESIVSVIEPMLQQVGSDLTESGKKQVIGRFQKMFVTTRQQPELKNNRICFPVFYSLGYGSAVSLSWEDKNFRSLLNAVALVIYDSPAMPELYDKQYRDWQEEIEYNKAYALGTDISFRFFKNRRVDLSFSTTDKAEQFWQLFQLETIILQNNSN